MSNIREYSEKVKIYEEEEFHSPSGTVEGPVQQSEEPLGMDNQSELSLKAG